MRRLYVLICLAVVTSVTTAGEQMEQLFGMGNPESFTLHAENLERDFHVFVRVPLSYAESDQQYPMVLLLDGGILFPMLAPYQLMLEIDEVVPEAIVVGVSYGGLGYANGNMRSTDYTAPADEPDYYGGAEAYQTFLRQQLLPEVDKRFRVDPHRRVIAGQSLGGQFVLYTALSAPELFWGHIAINPALHRNMPFFRDFQPTRDAQPTRLMVTMAQWDAERFREPAKAWIDAWRPPNNRHLQLQVAPLDDQHHASSAPQAYKTAMRWLFTPTPPAP